MEDFEPSMMQNLAYSFQEGGWGMYPIALVGCALPVVALVFLILALTSKSDRGVPLAVGLLIASALPPVIAVAASSMARANIEEAVAMVDPADKATILAGGESEVLNLSIFGYGASLFPGFIGCVLLGLALSRQPRFEDKPGS